jgi:hypothetical protein
MKDLDLTKMEFLIKLNDNVVIQRYFNVKDYSNSVRYGTEPYEYIKYLSEKLQYKLKMKTVVYMLDNYYDIEENPQILETSNTEGPEVFNIYVRLNEETICHTSFNAKVYPPKVRYTMDIRPEVKNILKELTDIFSEKNLVTE